ncbi:MAG: hypothetical protein RL154_1301, partial [Pseudomonadota bacterium]
MKFIKTLNTLGKNRVPFFFAINYDLQEILILEAIKESDEISFDINGKKSIFQPHTNKLPQISNIEPILFDEYKTKFDILQQKI